MATCTFFGHRDAHQRIEPSLRSTLIHLITDKNVDRFYVGNQGKFDYMVQRALKSLQLDYPHINYAVVIAYMPREKRELCDEDCSNTIYPEGLEKTPPKFAIIKRNIWMMDRSDYVVTYVNRIVGGAAQFKELAERKGKNVVNITDVD